MSEQRRPRTTWEKVRGDIDAGATGDKIAVPDPAAAPLGTDAEASDTPTSPEDIAKSAAAQEEGGRARRRRQRRHDRKGALFVMSGIAVLVAITALLVLISA